MIATGSAATAIAQVRPTEDYKTNPSSRWVIDLNLLGGMASQRFTTANTAPNYLTTPDSKTGQLSYKDGYSYGADAQLGFFMGEKRHFGIGAGFMYMRQQGFMKLDNYHVDYQATDGNGNIFRQVVTGHDITENVQTSMMNIPVVLKYKTRFSKHWGFAADAGALINLQTKNEYTTHASFDYGAIYKFAPSDGGSTTSVFDNAATPSADDWFITRAEFLKNNANGNVEDYFSKKRAMGYSVGEGMNPSSKTGTSSYLQGSVGLLLQPSVNYYLSDHVAVNLGGYYMMQPFKNNAQAGYKLTDGIGRYNSSLNNVTKVANHQYGINFGARFFLGGKREPLVITSVDQKPPTQCGTCDAMIALNGLTPNQPVTVDYSVNGANTTHYSATVGPDGQVKIANLCPGNYTGISATIKKRNAAVVPVTLTEPGLSISSQIPVNQTTRGGCDGSVIFNGLYPGKVVTINYSLNGAAQSPFVGTINKSGSITISGLCEGSYTGVMATISKCSINGMDFTLAGPIPPPPPPPAVEPQKAPEAILFDVNKSTIRKSSYPVLEEAAQEMKEDRTKKITIDGYTDISGTDAINNPLSVKRGNAVKKHLVKLGADSRKLKVVGHGSKSPAADNNSAEGRQQNRRATMK